MNPTASKDFQLWGSGTFWALRPKFSVCAYALSNSSPTKFHAKAQSGTEGAKKQMGPSTAGILKCTTITRE
jgi:hypothetical protein